MVGLCLTCICFLVWDWAGFLLWSYGVVSYRGSGSPCFWSDRGGGSFTWIFVIGDDFSCRSV